MRSTNGKRRSGGAQNYLWRVDWKDIYYGKKYNKVFRNKMDAMRFISKLQNGSGYDIHFCKWCP